MVTLHLVFDDGFVIPLFRCAAILRQKFGANYRKMGWYTKTNQSNMVQHGQNDPNWQRLV